MHMADALLSPTVGGVMYAASAVAVVYSASKVKKDELGEKKLPIMAVAGAFVFAGQMINFTIPATGSSGHIGGGILLAAMLGGAPALLAITAVLIIQCLFFADVRITGAWVQYFQYGVYCHACLFTRLSINQSSKKALHMGGSHSRRSSRWCSVCSLVLSASSLRRSHPV